jgi:hypothetical protein
MTHICTIPPAGWHCTRNPGHEGPCAAIPIASPTGWASPTLGRMYQDAEKLRLSLAQPGDSDIDNVLRRLLDLIEEADVELEGLAS